MKLSTKRLLAYLIDMAIIFILVMLINLFIGPNKYENDLKNLNEKYVLKEVSFVEYKNQYINLSNSIDKENIVINIFATILIITFFVIIPYYNNGQTYGSKIMKIKIKKEKLTIFDLIIRSIIVNGLGYMLLMFILLGLFEGDIYFILVNFLAFCQISVVIINGFMILYKKEHISLADVLTNSRIEEIKWESLQNKN